MWKYISLPIYTTSLHLRDIRVNNSVNRFTTSKNTHDYPPLMDNDMDAVCYLSESFKDSIKISGIYVPPHDLVEITTHYRTQALKLE